MGRGSEYVEWILLYFLSGWGGEYSSYIVEMDNNLVRKLIYNFILGGIIFSSLYYIGNVLEDTHLAAIVVFFPMSIISAFMYSTDKCKTYYKQCMSVATTSAITFLVSFPLFHAIKNKNVVVGLTLLIWMFLQWAIYRGLLIGE